MTDTAEIYVEVVALRKTMDEHYAALVDVRSRLDAIYERIKRCPAHGAQEVFDKEFHRDNASAEETYPSDKYRHQQTQLGGAHQDRAMQRGEA